MDSSRVQDGVTGLVFEKGNVEALASTLSRLIADKGLRVSLGEKARGYVERERTWQAMGERVKGWLGDLTPRA